MRGQVAGDSTLPPDGEYNFHATQWTAGAPKDLQDASTVASNVKAENDLGTVVGIGSSGPPDYPAGAYIWRAGKTVKVTSPGGDSNHFDVPVGVNDLDQVLINVNKTTAAVWQNGKLTSIPAGAGTSINDVGQVTGLTAADASGATKGFLWTAGKTTLLTAPGWQSSDAMQVNDLGQVIGNVTNTDTTNPDNPIETTHAALWDHGTFTDLGAPAGTTTTVRVCPEDCV